jgi:hypothetical protein
MAGEMEIIFSLSARIHVLLRRETKRIVDVEWMAVNQDYVREILKISRATGNAELHELVLRIEAQHPLLPRVNAPPPPPRNENDTTEQEAKYLFSLR